VGQLAVLARVVPGGGDLAARALRGALPGGLEQRVAGVLLDELAGALRDRFDAGGDHGAGLSRGDRVEGGAGGLDRGGAEAGHGRAGHGVQTEADRDGAGEVPTLVPFGDRASQLEVVDRGRVQLRYL